MRLNTVFFSITQKFCYCNQDKNWYNRHIKVRNLFRGQKMYNNYILTYTALLSTLIQMNGTMICGRKLPFSMPTRVHTTPMTSLTRSTTDLFRLKKGCSQSLPTQKLLTLKLKRFSVSFSHKRALRLQKPRYFYCRGIPLLLNKVHQAL